MCILCVYVYAFCQYCSRVRVARANGRQQVVEKVDFLLENASSVLAPAGGHWRTVGAPGVGHRVVALDISHTQILLRLACRWVNGVEGVFDWIHACQDSRVGVDTDGHTKEHVNQASNNTPPTA